MSSIETFEDITPELGYAPSQPVKTTTLNSHETPVVVFAETLGVIGVNRTPQPEPPSYAYPLLKNSIVELPHNELIQIHYSSEVINNISNLIMFGLVDWKWLTYLGDDASLVTNALGLPQHLDIVALENTEDIYQDGVENCKGATIMRTYQQEGETRPFIWLTSRVDSLYYHPDILGTLAVPYTVINPHPWLSITRNDWEEVMRFIHENSM